MAFRRLAFSCCSYNLRKCHGIAPSCSLSSPCSSSTSAKRTSNKLAREVWRRWQTPFSISNCKWITVNYMWIRT
jgi:hypothetical protein